MTILIAVISFAACSKSEGVSDNSGGNEITTDGSNLFMPSDESRKIVYTVYATIESGKFSELGDIINKDIQTEDITDKYTDASAVITAYQTELAILQQRLSEESNPSYAFQYSERITEINTIINKYQSMLNSYDSAVEFSTVTLNIYAKGEVPIDEKYGTQLEKTFFGSLNVLLEILKFLLKAIIAIIPFAIITTIVLIIIKLILKVLKKKYPEKFVKKQRHYPEIDRYGHSYGYRNNNYYNDKNVSNYPPNCNNPQNVNNQSYNTNNSKNTETDDTQKPKDKDDINK